MTTPAVHAIRLAYAKERFCYHIDRAEDLAARSERTYTEMATMYASRASAHASLAAVYLAEVNQLTTERGS